MCDHNGFTIEIDRFMHNVHTSLARAAHDAITTEVRVKDLEDRRQTPEWVQMYGRRLTAQQKDERWQNNGDKKRLAHHHPSDLLCSLTRELDRWRTAWRRLDSIWASPFHPIELSTWSTWGTWCACIYLYPSLGDGHFTHWYILTPMCKRPPSRGEYNYGNITVEERYGQHSWMLPR